MAFVNTPAELRKITPLASFTLQRLCFATSVVLGPTAILVAAFANPPYYGRQPGVASAITMNAQFSDLLDQTHLVAELIAAYVLPLGFLTMAWLANSRAPVLASLGAVLSLLGFLPLSLYVGQDALYYDIARWGSHPQWIELAQRWNTQGGNDLLRHRVWSRLGVWADSDRDRALAGARHPRVRRHLPDM